MKYANDLTFNQFLDIQKHEVAEMHTKAKELLNISHVTWKKRRDSGDFTPYELYLLGNRLFNIAPGKLFKFCTNSAKNYYKMN